MLMAETTEELRKRPEIRKELERARGEERPEKVETHGRDRFWFVLYVIVLAVCAAGYFLIGAKLIPLPDAGISIAQRILRGVALITVVLTVARAISCYGIGRIEDASTRFTLQRIERLAVALVVLHLVPIPNSGSQRHALARPRVDDFARSVTFCSPVYQSPFP